MIHKHLKTSSANSEWTWNTLKSLNFSVNKSSCLKCKPSRKYHIAWAKTFTLWQFLSSLGFNSAKRTYLCDPKEVHLLDQMDFNLIRLGEVNSDLNEMEPYIRSLDHLSVDISVIKASEAPANTSSS